MSQTKKLQRGKMGTTPWYGYVDGRCVIEAGRKIRVRDDMHGSKWSWVLVTRINSDGYIFMER